MGTSEIGRVALMSIHPAYAEQILAGTKKIEFRKRPVASDVTHILVYATAPVSRVTGAFSVESQVTQSPQTLWRSYRQVSGIKYRDLMKYYRGYKVGTGIKIKKTYTARKPLSLTNDLGIMHPPQSYRYLDTAVAHRILEGMKRG